MGATCARWAHPVARLGHLQPRSQRLHPSAQRQSARLRLGLPYVRVQAGAEVPEAVTPAATSARERDMGERWDAGAAEPEATGSTSRTAAKRLRYADRWFGLLRAPIGIRRRTYTQELADKSWWQNRSLSPISEPRGQFSVAGAGQAADLTGGGVWLAG